jgi:stage V sporulation protein G
VQAVKITEVRIFQKAEDADKKLRAFATVTLDSCFVVRDIKIIEGSKGLFVAMPSRRSTEACPRCRHRNVVHSRFCNQCGSPLNPIQKTEPEKMDELARQNEHRDIAHPITVECREYLQSAVLETYEKEKTKLHSDAGFSRNGHRNSDSKSS